MITLHGFALSNYYNKVKLVLLEKGLPFTEQATPTRSTDPAVRAASPLGKIPFVTLADGRAAVMVLRPDDFDATGALAEETERLVDIPQVVGSVRAVALVTQQRDRGKHLTRISFRSKSPDPLTGEPAVDVAELAERFGGGGHARAAGAKVEAPLDEVLPRIEAALASAVA